MNKKTKKNKFAVGSTKYALLSVLGIAGFFVIWQLLVVSGIINSKYLAAPTDIIKLFFVKIAETAPDGNQCVFQFAGVSFGAFYRIDSGYSPGLAHGVV